MQEPDGRCESGGQFAEPPFGAPAASHDLAADEPVDAVGDDPILAAGFTGDGLAAVVARVDRVQAGIADEQVDAEQPQQAVGAGPTPDRVAAAEVEIRHREG